MNYTHIDVSECTYAWSCKRYAPLPGKPDGVPYLRCEYTGWSLAMQRWDGTHLYRWDIRGPDDFLAFGYVRTLPRCEEIVIAVYEAARHAPPLYYVTNS